MILPTDASPLIISVATTCAATVATFFLGMSAARIMYDVRGGFRAWIDGILTLPLVLPPTVVGFFLLLIFGRRSFIGRALEHVGVTIAFSWPATVIAATVIAFPLMYRTTLGAFEQVNPTLLEAARTLGASEWVVFRRVLLPLSLPGILAGTILTFILSMNAYATPVLLGGPKFRMMGPLIYGQFQLNNWPFGAAAAFILMAATLGLTATANILVQRRFRR